MKNAPGKPFTGSGTPRDKEVAQLKHELARVKRNGFFRERGNVLRKGVVLRNQATLRC
jgi:hypothetical protein